jgi:GMP synthase (glutamine-hydrolysing)
VGQSLGLPPALVWRQPFPGPGLAIRILCTKKPYLTADDPAIIKTLAAQFHTDTISSTLLPCRTVGVQGDARTYSNLVALSSKGAPNWTELLAMAKEVPFFSTPHPDRDRP